MKVLLNYKRAFFAIGLVALLSSLSFGCKKSSSSSPGPNEVWMQNMAFNPLSLTVPVGTTITWSNKDGYAHTVTSDSTLFDSGNVNGSGTFTYQFTKAGTFAYHCNIHANMHANIIVH